MLIDQTRRPSWIPRSRFAASSSASRSRRRSARSACSSSAGRWPRAGCTASSPGSASPRPTPTYGAIAAFGLSAITDVLVNARQVLGLVGGVFLLWLAWQTIRSTPTEAATVTDAARRLCRGVPLDPGPDDGQPDDDPVVRRPVRGPRRDERGDRRRRTCRARRPARLDDLVGRPDDGHRDAADPRDARSGSTGSTSSPASSSGPSRSSRSPRARGLSVRGPFAIGVEHAGTPAMLVRRSGDRRNGGAARRDGQATSLVWTVAARRSDSR